MIIITGGAGFIGSVLAWHLNNEGYQDILLVDSLKSTEKWGNLVGLNYSDYLEKEIFLDHLLNGDFDSSNIDVIFHLGACSDTTEKNASYLVRNNYEYSKALAGFALSENIRFIYASSAATYGSGDHGYSDDHRLLTQLRPLNMYGYSKQMFDLWLLKNNVLDKVVGLKYFNVYGPNEYHKQDMRSVICKAVDQIKSNGCFNLFKSYHPDYAHGEQKRDFIYVKDAVRMTSFFYTSYHNAYGIYNVGSGEAHSWNELANAIFMGMDMSPEINYIDMPDYLVPKYQYFTLADCSKIRALGYTEKNWLFQEAVIDYVKNYLMTHQYISAVK